MKLKTQIAIITLALAASTSLLWSADQPRHTGGPTIVGVWQVTSMGVNCNDPNQPTGINLRAIITFHSDGTMETALPNATTNEYGLWKRKPGPQNYSFRDVSYSYDENGAFAGSDIVTANIHLDTATTFSYSARIQFFDANGAATRGPPYQASQKVIRRIRMTVVMPNHGMRTSSTLT
jgi:hypothetical protein